MASWTSAASTTSRGDTRLRVVDLCSGCGGSSEGLRQAGFPVTFAVDCWNVALDSHAANHPNAEHVLGDVRDLVGSIGRADVVVGSPPCQPFSQFNFHARRGARPDLSVIEACLQVVREAGPRWWFLENVPRAAAVFRSSGVPVHFIKASDHGLPHRRRRVFAGNFQVPFPTAPTAETIHTPVASDGRRNVSGWSGEWVRRKGIQSQLGRRVEPEDALALMGFPKGYIVLGTREQRIAQVGNAVAPPVSRAIAAAQARAVAAQVLLPVVV